MYGKYHCMTHSRDSSKSVGTKSKVGVLPQKTQVSASWVEAEKYLHRSLPIPLSDQLPVQQPVHFLIAISLPLIASAAPVVTRRNKESPNISTSATI